MANLTATQIAAMSDFDADTIANFTADLGNSQAVDALTLAGALSLTRTRTEFGGTGALAYTLAAPTTVNQRKVIVCVAGAAPANTLTITAPDDTAGFVCPATFFFDIAGQEIELQATSALKWRCVRVRRAGGLADNVVLGTTAITNKLWRTYSASITGTAASALPNGAAVGERLTIICSTIGLAPVGEFTGLFTGGASVAYTHLGAIGVAASTTVVGDMAELEWTGASWRVLWQAGCILS